MSEDDYADHMSEIVRDIVEPLPEGSCTFVIVGVPDGDGTMTVRYHGTMHEDVLEQCVKDIRKTVIPALRAMNKETLQ